MTINWFGGEQDTTRSAGHGPTVARISRLNNGVHYWTVNVNDGGVTRPWAVGFAETMLFAQIEAESSMRRAAAAATRTVTANAAAAA